MITTGPQTLGTALKSLLSQLGLSKKAKEGLIFSIWRSAVGEKISQNATPYSIRRGILYVACKSSVWAQELGFLKEEIRNKLNARLEEEVIKDIKFRMRTAKKSAKPLVKKPPSRPKVLSEEDRRKIEQIISPIQDEPLKSILRRVLQRWKSI